MVSLSAHQSLTCAFLIAMTASIGCREAPTTEEVLASNAPLLRPIPPAQALPMTGRANPQFAPYDEAMLRLMAQGAIPGATLALAHRGCILYSRGYGWADVENHVPVQPDSLFRLASASKPFTAAAIMVLAEEGKLNLDDRALELVTGLHPPEGSAIVPRLAEITVRHLLLHAGGWDRTFRADPLLRETNLSAAQRLHLEAPVSAADMLRVRLAQPPDLFPGTKYAYSNLGYLLLGRVIEQVSGEPYDQYVRGHILEPAGITRMRIGGTRIEELAPGEVRYYDYTGSQKIKSLYPGEGLVDWPNGGFSVPSLDAAAGWIASAQDLVRFMAALDGFDLVPPLLSESARAAMFARPPAPLWSDSEQYYALGWRCKPRGDGVFAWHNGTMPGTTALVARTPDGYAWAVLMNSRPQDWDAFDKELNRTFEQLALMGTLKQAVQRE